MKETETKQTITQPNPTNQTKTSLEIVSCYENVSGSCVRKGDEYLDNSINNK